MPVGRRAAIIAAIDGASGDLSMPMFAATKVSMIVGGRSQRAGSGQRRDVPVRDRLKRGVVAGGEALLHRRATA